MTKKTDKLTEDSTDKQLLEVQKSEHENSKLYRFLGFLALLASGAYAVWVAIYLPRIQYPHEVVKMNDQAVFDLGVVEAEHVMGLANDKDLADSDDELSLERLLCDLKDNGVIRTSAGLDKINGYTRQGAACTEIMQLRLQAIAAQDRFERCEALSTIVRKSCSASDKSGFNSRPSARCSVKIIAGEDRFFTAASYNLRRTGKGRLSSTATPKTNATSYTTTHACSDSRGTGRTCNVNADISAKSYPDECSELPELN